MKQNRYDGVRCKKRRSIAKVIVREVIIGLKKRNAEVF